MALQNLQNVLGAIASFREAADWLQKMPDVIADRHHNLYMDASETITDASMEVEGLADIVTEFDEMQEEEIQEDPDYNYMGPGETAYWDAILKLVNSK